MPLLPSADLTEEEAVQIAEDYVPTVDQADDTKPPPATYRDWTAEDTRIVVFTTASHRYSKDRPAASRADARAQCELAFGRILEANYLSERFFFRVSRQSAKQGAL